MYIGTSGTQPTQNLTPVIHGLLVFTDGIPPAMTLLKYITLQIRKPAVSHDSEPVTSVYISHNTYPSMSRFGTFFMWTVNYID